MNVRRVVHILLRICNICETNQIGDEYHYVLKCSALLSIRKKLFNEYLLRNPSTIKFRSLMSTSNPVTLLKICKLISNFFLAGRFV